MISHSCFFTHYDNCDLDYPRTNLQFVQEPGWPFPTTMETNDIQLKGFKYAMLNPNSWCSMEVVTPCPASFLVSFFGRCDSFSSKTKTLLPSRFCINHHNLRLLPRSFDCHEKFRRQRYFRRQRARHGDLLYIIEPGGTRRSRLDRMHGPTLGRNST